MLKDPRIHIIEKRIKNINHVIAVASCKGGVGKTLISTAIALILSENYKVGLLDLDFTSPSVHIILNAKTIMPKEDKGILPNKIHNIKFMSGYYYCKNKLVPLRKSEYSNAMIELFAIVRWKNLDYLIIDLPSGIEDVVLNTLCLVKNLKLLIITTPSKLAISSTKKLLTFLKSTNIQVIGVIENMAGEIKIRDFKVIGKIYFDDNVEKTIGNINAMKKSNFLRDVRGILRCID